MPRYYLMPAITRVMPNGLLVAGAPKYLYSRADETLPIIGGAYYNFGRMPVVMVSAQVIDDKLHDKLATYSDVYVFPEKDTMPLGMIEAAKLQAAMRYFGLPAGWVMDIHTVRGAIKGLAMIGVLARGYSALYSEKMLDAADVLNETWSRVDVTRRQKLATVAAALHYDVTAIKGSSTLHDAIVDLAAQWGNSPIKFGSEWF